MADIAESAGSHYARVAEYAGGHRGQTAGWPACSGSTSGSSCAMSTAAAFLPPRPGPGPSWGDWRDVGTGFQCVIRWGMPEGMISYRHDDGPWLNAAISGASVASSLPHPAGLPACGEDRGAHPGRMRRAGSRHQPARTDVLLPPHGTYWRSSNFDRRVLAPAYPAASWRDPGGNGPWTWHSLRHVLCTTALFTWKLDTTDVSAMAGHANVRTTLDMYVVRHHRRRHRPHPHSHRIAPQPPRRTWARPRRQ